jgi:glycosyltransferase involved in cell wall biosynthesis
MTQSFEPPKSATVLITTKDRKECLPRAIDSVLGQTYPVELLVVDDGSTDGTYEFITSKYPNVSVIRNDVPKGIIAARNDAAKVAMGEVLFTLDDDAEFRTTDVVVSVMEDFCHPRVAVVGIPFDNHLSDGKVERCAVPGDRNSDNFVCSFQYGGGANAMRRKLFLSLGGYRGTGRQAEESTLSVQLLSHGYVVRIASKAMIDHYPLRGPNQMKVVVFSTARNSLKFAFDWVPLVYVVPHLLVGIVNIIRLGVKQKQLSAAMSGIGYGVTDMIGNWSDRQPISLGIYRAMRYLIRKPCRFSELEPMLGPQLPLSLCT